MEENFSLSNCSNDDALSVKDKVFKILQIKEAIKKSFSGELSNELYKALNNCGVSIDPGGYLVGNKFYRCNNQWFNQGIDCEILKPGSQGWQTGKLKIKVTLEFIPDQPNIPEPESPLDDLRRMMNE
ncbi:KGK domain protein [Nostoc sp. PCC 7524]|jgi:hypothetical protein|uniref:KGK domain-containing protein n=1 Tax=Nostoc sp. (strain ATCC 29411 / PCC 7524) TaxID=28072 RepID=UPI00029F378E|nr:KGK domain-containing protein [Nostoc sp. PCC 7524]AFY46505.1 KGK domain protein [Nostoc sp. PCC 7524]